MLLEAPSELPQGGRSFLLTIAVAEISDRCTTWAAIVHASDEAQVRPLGDYLLRDTSAVGELFSSGLHPGWRLEGRELADYVKEELYVGDPEVRRLS